MLLHILQELGNGRELALFMVLSSQQLKATGLIGLNKRSRVVEGSFEGGFGLLGIPPGVFRFLLYLVFLVLCVCFCALSFFLSFFLFWGGWGGVMEDKGNPQGATSGLGCCPPQVLESEKHSGKNTSGEGVPP